MTCQVCWSIPSPPVKRSYLIEIVDQKTGRWGRCVFQSECSHGMQEWAQTLADAGALTLHDQNDEKFCCTDPRVIHVDDKAVAHLPIVDPVN
jgi:hypothetical protein